MPIFKRVLPKMSINNYTSLMKRNIHMNSVWKPHAFWLSSLLPKIGFNRKYFFSTKLPDETASYDTPFQSLQDMSNDVQTKVAQLLANAPKGILYIYEFS